MRRGLFSEFYGIHQPIWNTAKTFLEGLSEIRIHITFPLPTNGTNTIDSRREYFTGLLLIAFVEGAKTLNSLNSDTKFK